MPKQKRERYRVEYEKKRAPRLHLGSRIYVISNLSESGIRFVCDNTSDFVEDEALTGQVNFADEGAYFIEGKVVRVDEADGFVSLVFSRGIPLSRVTQEQRKIIQRKRNRKAAA